MWARASLTHHASLRQSPFSRRRHPPRQQQPRERHLLHPHSSLLVPSHSNSRRTAFLARELVDDLHVDIASAGSLGTDLQDSNNTNSKSILALGHGGSSSATTTSHDDTLAALWLPFHPLLLSYALHPSLRTLATSHALLMASLRETPDLLQQLTACNPCGGGVTAARLRCVAAAFTQLQPYRHDVQKLLSLSVPQRRLVDEVRLVQLVASISPNASVLVKAELTNKAAGSGARWYASELLEVLLSVPCSVDVLREILLAALGQCPSGITAHAFQQATHALLKNDNFFCERSFDAMHRLLVDVMLRAVASGSNGRSSGSWSKGTNQGSRLPATPPSFDFLAVRWTPLVNRWSRVYAKNGRGVLLYECLCMLLRAAPAVETKLPSSFYVRLLGTLLDAGVAQQTETAHATAVQTGARRETSEIWMKMQAVARDALRLFGRNPADLRTTWVLLLKGALTLPPLRNDYQRLLDAYHLCAQCGHRPPLDRQGFLQVTRLVSEAIPALCVDDVVESLIPQFCTFLFEQDTANFLWVLDGVGATLTDLWATHGAAVVKAAQEVLTTTEKLLRDRRVTGVDMYANPVIARALDHFHLGGPALFWWKCGCGAELPCGAKRCVACLRTSNSSGGGASGGGLSWTCPACRKTHRAPCTVQACSCGQVNPRLAAATAAGHAICEACGEAKATAASPCVRCAEQQSAAARPTTCPHCHTTYKANALHCPDCFTVNPAKPPLFLWHCEGCDDFNYSIWSVCRSCRAPRKNGAFFAPFVPWTCGCGARNHPGRLTCSACGTGARHHTYTCPGCYAHVAMRALRRVVVTVDGKKIPVHLCSQCQAPHPRSEVLLHSPLLPRHCMLCAKTIHPASVAASGAFHHCGVVQRVNENCVFQCRHCNARGTDSGAEAAVELQTGYHCRHCLFPRPEVAALLANAARTTRAVGGGDDDRDGDENDKANRSRDDDTAAEAVSEATPVTSVWRCLHETEESGELCGQWNYGWCTHCLGCGTGRPDSAFECRAKAQLWQCETCGQSNRPIDVLFCPHCKSGLQPVLPCGTCGVPHLSFSCRIHL